MSNSKWSRDPLATGAPLLNAGAKNGHPLTSLITFYLPLQPTDEIQLTQSTSTMEKIASKQLKSLRSTTVLALMLLFLSMNLKKSDCLSTAANLAAGCNATVIGDCLPEDEEFMMESEISRMLLARPLKPLTPPAQNPIRPFCDQKVYGSCLPRPNKFYDKRPCNYNNLCNRKD